MQNQNSQRKIIAELWLKADGCVIAINAAPIPLDFVWHDKRLFASDGTEIIIPARDEKTRGDLIEKLLGFLQHNPESVFVCEFGPLGPIKEHRIALAS